MRRALLDTLVDLAERDPRVVLLTGDLGFTVIEPFAERFPERFFNVGVAEQNMIGLATGLAEAGLIPFTYSLATFTSLRPYEFIRNGPVLHGLPVRMIGVGGGFDYGVQGATHHGLEDLGVLRLLPGLTVLAPADHRQLETAVRATWDLPGPVYYRVGKDDTTTVPGLDGRFALGRAEVVPETETRPDPADGRGAGGVGGVGRVGGASGAGGDTDGGGVQVVLVSTGAVAVAAEQAVSTLRAEGVACTAVVVASIAPAPVHDLVRLLRGVPLVVTAEAHHAVGGLGSLVAEVVADHGLGCRLIRQGVHLRPGGPVGSQAWFHERAGLTPEALVAVVTEALAAGRGPDA